MNYDGYSAGYAQLDITPPLGVRMDGYGTAGVRRVSRGVLDPICVRAVAFGHGEKRAVMLVLDMLAMYGPELARWPDRIAQRLGLPAGAVFACCTHSHTTPGVGDYRDEPDRQYDDWLFRRLGDAAQLALDDLRPVTDVRGGQTDTGPMAFSRRWYMTDGSVQTNPAFSTGEQRQRIDRPASDTDNTMRVMRILRADAPELVLVNYQSHPDCTGGDLISADFPGALCLRVEELVPNAHCVFLNGAEGQMVAIDRVGERGFNYPKDPQGARDYGRALADAAMSVYHTLPSTETVGFAFGQKYVRSPSKRGQLTKDEYERRLALEAGGRTAELDPDPRQAFYKVLMAKSVRDMEVRQVDFFDLPVTVITFCGLAFVGYPGEPFNEAGRWLRAEGRYPVTCVCCQTNGSWGYLPHREGFAQGGYEPVCTRQTAGVLEALTDAARALFDEFDTGN